MVMKVTVATAISIDTSAALETAATVVGTTISAFIRDAILEKLGKKDDRYDAAWVAKSVHKIALDEMTSEWVAKAAHEDAMAQSVFIRLCVVKALRARGMEDDQVVAALRRAEGASDDVI